QQSERLREVARIVTTPIEREQVADRILEQLRRVIDYDSASVQLIQGDRRYLIGSQQLKFDASHSILLRNLSQDPLISRIVKDKQPLVLSDVTQEALWDKEIPETAWINSWIGIPLVIRGRVMGLLTVDHAQAGYYTAADGEIAAAFANHAALALRNAELYRKSELLGQAIIALSRVHEAEQLYDTLLKSAIETLDCDYCTIFLMEADNILSSFVAGGKLFSQPPRLRFAPGEGLAGWVYQRQQSLLVNDTAADKRYKADPDLDIKPRSIILSPLRRGRKVIGVISADLERTDAFDENDLHLLDTLTLNASTILENIDYFKDFQVLHDTATGLAQQPDLTEIYQTTVASALKTLHCSHCTIFTLDKTTGELTAKARIGAPQPVSAVKRFRLGEGLAGKVVQARQSRLVKDAARDEDFVEGGVKPRSAPRSIILAPVKIEDEVIGVISADKDEIDGFTEHNLRMLETLALDVGIAINVRRQQNRLKAIADFQRAISDILPIQQQLEQIHDKMSGLMDTGSMFIALYERETGLIRFPLVYEQGQLIPDDQKTGGQVYAPRRFGARGGMTEWVMRRKEPLRVGDLAAWPQRTEIEPEFRRGVKCCLLAPALIKNEAIGVIGLLDFERANVFDQADQDLLATMAQQAAIAIENSRLFHQGERQRHELQLVNKIGQLLMSTLDPRQIPRLLLQEVIRLFQVEGASLWRIAGQQIECLFSLDAQGREESFLDKIKEMTFAAGQGVLGTVAETGVGMIVNDPRAEPKWDPRVDEATGFKTQAILAVPLVYQQQTVGVIEILNRADGQPFTAEDQNFLTAIVSPAAIALENARLYQDLERANQDLKRQVEALRTLTEVGQTITKGLRLTENEILELIYEQARQLTRTQDMYIALYDDAAGMITFALAVEKGERKTYPARQADVEKRGRTEEIIFTRKPLLHKTQQEALAWYRQPGHAQFLGRVSLCWIGVPMIVGERVIGMISVHDWEQEYAYDELDLHVLDAMADQAAIAFENARLYQDLERANQDLEHQVEALYTLNQVGQALTAGIRLKEREVVELIHAQAGRLMAMDNMYIALYDEVGDTVRFGLVMEKGKRLPAKELQPGGRFAPRSGGAGRTEAIIRTKKPI
ncbi:MAG: GAF domain-containing protein, partial [Chloroflexota bacterium]